MARQLEGYGLEGFSGISRICSEKEGCLGEDKEKGRDWVMGLVGGFGRMGLMGTFPGQDSCTIIICGD